VTLAAVIRLENLTLAYPSVGPVLQVESLQVQEGESIAIIGPSGSGKTTLLRSVKGQLPGVKGRADILGVDLARASRKIRRDIGRQVALIPQQFHLVPQLSVLSNTLCGRLGITSRWRSTLGMFTQKDRAEAWSAIREVGLSARTHQRASVLSGGEQQRVAIARGLAQEPRIILADEPVASLDPMWAADVLQLLQDVRQHRNSTLVMTLHQPELARRFATRIIGLRRGRVAFDLPSESVDDSLLATLYAGEERALEPQERAVAVAESSMSAIPRDPSKAQRIAWMVSLNVVLLALLAWSFAGTETNPRALLGSSPRIAEFFDRMWPPDLSWEPTEARPFSPPLRLAGAAVAVTFQISILGTFLGAVVAFALGLLGATTLTPGWVHYPIKVLLALVRSLPIILLALIFVAALGLGPMPGVLAVAIHSLGMLGKLYAEEFEMADARVWEAIDNTGASWLQKVRYALLPQAARQVASHTLLRFEMNLRESAVLGLVGVGGLGLWIENYRRAFDYPSVATMVLITMLVVLVVDQLTLFLRRRLL